MRAARIAGLAGRVDGPARVPVPDIQHHPPGDAGGDAEIARAVAIAVACAGDCDGFGLQMTLRLTSPQAAMVVSSAASIRCIACLTFDLITPCSWIVCRVVMRKVWLA